MDLRAPLAKLGITKRVDSPDHVRILKNVCQKLGIKPELELLPKPAKKVLQDISRTRDVSVEAVKDSLYRHLVAHHIKRNERMQQRRTHTRIHVETTHTLANSAGSVFYSSAEWVRLRYSVLHERGNKCEACGASPSTGAVIHVDHVEPRYLNPDRALDRGNLQILCSLCNEGKSSVYSTDWRGRK